MSAVTYTDVIGQHEVKEHVLRMVHEGRVPHALMFSGCEGAGAMPMALALARHLLCEHPTSEGPCQTCAGCRMTAGWAHPDLHFSFPVYICPSGVNSCRKAYISTPRCGFRTSRQRTSR